MNAAVWSLLEPTEGAERPRSISLSLLGDDAIAERSHGCVTLPETLEYRTSRPARGGLFCEEIFGKAASEASEGLDLATQLDPFEPPERAARFGHVDLCVPVLHPLYLEHRGDELAGDLGLDVEVMLRILAYEISVVLDPGDSAFDIGDVVEPELEIPSDVRVGAGAPALAKLYEEAWGEAPMFMRKILVLPPDMRPLVPLAGGGFASSDLNDLYRRVINRNKRCARLIELDAPEIIMRNEERLLQAAMHALFINRGEGMISGPEERPLRSLWDALGLGVAPWERVVEWDRRAREDPGVFERMLDGPQHWFVCHLAALGLALGKG